MIISDTMNLDQLGERVGTDDTAFLKCFRDLLSAEFSGEDTSDIEWHDWSRLLDKTANMMGLSES